MTRTTPVPTTTRPFCPVYGLQQESLLIRLHANGFRGINWTSVLDLRRTSRRSFYKTERSRERKHYCPGCGNATIAAVTR